ncbi:MAG: O-antigen ligase family protein [Anaerolineaceae bacterium]|nr:O-antigen ligase family protein [Anaerolineaceae bacterium]
MPVSQPKKISTIYTYILLVGGLILACLAGGYIWRGEIAVQFTALAFAAVLACVLIYWRGLRQRAELVHSPIDGLLALAAIVIIGLWILSPDPRQGLGRIGWLLGYLVLFVLLVDAFETFVERRLVINALLWVSGLLLAAALLETYGRYALWWQASGSWTVSPPYAYRFTSLLGHSNALMALANLCAPLAVVTLLQPGRGWGRLGAGLWLTVYLAALPFSSSRGGLVGLAAWAGVLLCLWAYEKGWLASAWKFLRARPGWAVAGLLPLALVLGGIWLALTQFGAHPTHGVGLLDTRRVMWETALRIWKEHLWFGAGPGRFAYAYLEAGATVPPAYWPTHPHQFLLNILAEFGLVGLVTLLAILLGSILWAWRAYSRAAVENRAYSRAILAAVVAWMAMSMLDDFSGWGAIMVPMVMLSAWLVTAPEEKMARWSQVNFSILILPVAILTCGSLLSLWNYLPMANALHARAAGAADWHSVATAVSESAARDPNAAFYTTQAGLAWAAAWQQDYNESDLARARQYLARSLELEPSPALLQADLAVLDWYAGDRERAIFSMRRAKATSPDEPSFPLNLGWFKEQQGEGDAAINYYRQALDLAPGWSWHPYWQQNELRRRALREWSADQAEETAAPAGSYVQKAQQSLVEGDVPAVNAWLARAEWTGEPAAEILAVRGALAAAQGDPQAVSRFDALIVAQDHDYQLRSSNSFSSTYTVWLYGRNGLNLDIVPGYIQLSDSPAEIEALRRLYQQAAGEGDCEAAGRYWQRLKRREQGGSVWYSLNTPACTAAPSDSNSTNP